MSDLWTIARRLATVAPHARWPRQFAAALKLEAAEPEPVDELPVRIAFLLEAVSEETVYDLLYDFRTLQGDTSDHWDWPLIEAVCGAAEVMVRSGSTVPKPVANVPRDEDIDLSLSLDGLTVAVLDLLRTAQEEVVILSPFFTPEVLDQLGPPLEASAGRGVTIRIITRSLTYGDEPTGNRQFLRRLLSEETVAAQTHLYEYVDSGYDATIHAKLIMVDDERAYLGTANMTHRGLIENLELGIITEEPLTRKLRSFVQELLDSEHIHNVAFHPSNSNFER